MQAVAQKYTQSQEETRGLNITVEFLAYFALIVFALVLRFAELDTVPMNPTESARALSVWRVVFPNAGGQLLSSDSPLMFWLQGFSFSILGGNETAARFWPAVSGILLALAPLLFRDRFGRGRTFLLSLTLALSPTAIITSRTSDPVIITLLFSVIGFWFLWRYWDNRKQSDALWAVGLFTAMIFLSESGGPILALILIVSMIGALFLMTLRGSDDESLPGNELLSLVRDHVHAFPWMNALVIAGGVVIVGGTGFMIYTSGLSAVSQLIGESLTGFWHAQPNTPTAFPVLIVAFYEPLLVIFAMISVRWYLRRGEMSFVEYFLIVWVGVVALVSIFYAGVKPAFSLWMTIPLAALASGILDDIFVHRASSLFWLDDLFQDIDNDEYTRALLCAKWIAAFLTFSLMVMLSVHLQEMGRSLLTLPDSGESTDLFRLFLEPAYIKFRYAAIWVLITIIFATISFFVVAGFYGNTTTLQGTGLGLFIFMLITGMGSGWNASVSNASNPSEFWHTTVVDEDAYLLRETLFELSERDSKGFPVLPLTVVMDDITLTENGVVAWLLRDYTHVSYVKSMDEARGQQLIIGSGAILEPELGGSYVGQRFVIHQTREYKNMRLGDVPAWWLLRRVRPIGTTPQVAILWLRQDVYDGLPVEKRP